MHAFELVLLVVLWWCVLGVLERHYGWSEKTRRVAASMTSAFIVAVLVYVTVLILVLSSKGDA